jgi:hypothetical protein
VHGEAFTSQQQKRTGLENKKASHPNNALIHRNRRVRRSEMLALHRAKVPGPTESAKHNAHTDSNEGPSFGIHAADSRSSKHASDVSMNRCNYVSQQRIPFFQSAVVCCKRQCAAAVSSNVNSWLPLVFSVQVCLRRPTAGSKVLKNPISYIWPRLV